jgi:UDP-glucuronate 4-epimerase
LLEKCLRKKAVIEFLPMQPGDVPATAADISALAAATGFAPSTPVETGIARFVEWYREYYKV